jgi:hypothetical protein
MTDQVAFLRGINVGGNAVIAMDDLRKAFEALGFENVKTPGASGKRLVLGKRRRSARCGACRPGGRKRRWPSILDSEFAQRYARR